VTDEKEPACHLAGFERCDVDVECSLIGRRLDLYARPLAGQRLLDQHVDVFHASAHARQAPPAAALKQ